MSMAPSPTPPRSILKPLGLGLGLGERSPYKQTDYSQHLLLPAFSTSTPAAPALHDYYQFLATTTATQPLLEDVTDDGPLRNDVVDDYDMPDFKISVDSKRFPNVYSAYSESQQIIANPDWADHVPTGGVSSHVTLKRERDSSSENISSFTADQYGFLHCSATSQQYHDVAYSGPYYFTPNKTRRLYMKQEGETDYFRFYRELYERIRTGEIDISDFLDGNLSFSGSHLNPPEEISLLGRSSVDPTSSADLFNCSTSDSKSSVPLQPNTSENISGFPTDHHRFLQRNDTSLLYDDVSYGGPYYYTPNKKQRLVMKVEDENAWQRSFREMVASSEYQSWYYNCGATGGHQTHSHETGTRNLYEYPGNSSMSTQIVDDPVYSGPNYILPCNRQRLATQVKDENECQRSFGVSQVAKGRYNCDVSDGPHVHSHEMETRSLEVGTFSEIAVNDLITPVVSNPDLVCAKDGGGNGLREAGPPKGPTRVARERRKPIVRNRRKPIARERRKPRWLKDYV